MTSNLLKYHKTKNISYGNYYSNDCKVEIHLHDFNEIFMATTSNVRYYVEGNAYDMSAGDIILTNSQELHRPVTTDDNPYGRAYIHFDPEDFNPIFPIDYNPLKIFTNRLPGQGNLIQLGHLRPNPIYELFKELEPLTAVETPKTILLAKALMIQLLVKIDDLYTLDTHTLPNQLTIDARIKAVLNYLDDHYTKPLNLDSLSKHHFMDKYYLCHLFKKNTGFSISEYLQSKRIQLAKSLIAQGLPISQVSLGCGFEDYSNFYKTFKKLTHSSPRAYKESLLL